VWKNQQFISRFSTNFPHFIENFVKISLSGILISEIFHSKLIDFKNFLLYALKVSSRKGFQNCHILF